MNIGEQNKDLILDKINEDGSCLCHCVDCKREHILDYKQINNKKRKGFYCKCKVEKVDRLKYDLRGHIYGDLEVIDMNYEATEKTIETYGKRKIVWKCKCLKCGHISLHFKSDLDLILKQGSSGCGRCYGYYLVGQKFGRLTVIEDLGTKGRGEKYCRCLCDCGESVNIRQVSLIYGKTQSCGCLHNDLLAQRNKETASLNGDSVNPKYKRIHQIWTGMKSRCFSPNNTNYHLYGGRGITVCDEWLIWQNFRDWALNNGYQEDLTIDRIDGNDIYRPGNCRWATYEEQGNNTSKNKRITYKGRTQTLSEWCKELNLDYHRTKARLNGCDYSVEEAFELGKYELRGVS